MNATKLLTVPLALVILLMGWLWPNLLLLDLPFGLAFYITDKFGAWEAGLLWAPKHRLLAIVCAVVWPLVTSTLIGYGIARIARVLWHKATSESRLSALLFVVIVFGIFLSVRVQPGTHLISYFGYTTANY